MGTLYSLPGHEKILKSYLQTLLHKSCTKEDAEPCRDENITCSCSTERWQSSHREFISRHSSPSFFTRLSIDMFTKLNPTLQRGFVTGHHLKESVIVEYLLLFSDLIRALEGREMEN